MAGYSYSATGKNIAQVHRDMKRLPDAMLDEMSRQGDAYSSLALTELEDRNTQRAAQQAMQPPPPTVADQVRAEASRGGVETLPLAEKSYKEGGIIGYANEGLVNTNYTYDPDALERQRKEDLAGLLGEGFFYEPENVLDGEVVRERNPIMMQINPLPTDYEKDLEQANTRSEDITRRAEKGVTEEKETLANLLGSDPTQSIVNNPRVNFGPQTREEAVTEIKDFETEFGYNPDLYQTGLESLKKEQLGFDKRNKQAKTQAYLDIASGVYGDPENPQTSLLQNLITGSATAAKTYSTTKDQIRRDENQLNRDIASKEEAQNLLKKGNAKEARTRLDASKAEKTKYIIDEVKAARDRIQKREGANLNAQTQLVMAQQQVAVRRVIANLQTKTEESKMALALLGDVIKANTTALTSGSITNSDLLNYLGKVKRTGTELRLLEAEYMENHPESKLTGQELENAAQAWDLDNVVRLIRNSNVPEQFRAALGAISDITGGIIGGNEGWGIKQYEEGGLIGLTR